MKKAIFFRLLRFHIFSFAGGIDHTPSHHAYNEKSNSIFWETDVMEDQKIENLLNLALDATEEERAKSLELDVGYDPIDRKWDLIIKYSGSLEAVRALGAEVVELINEYAIITILESQITQLSEIPEIEYIEKPKRLFFQVDYGRAVSCIQSVQQTSSFAGGLRGAGTLVAVLDSGVDYTSPDFRNEDGTTRILNLWDQTVTGNPPTGYVMGTEYTKEQINEALLQNTIADQQAVVASRDISGHGTPVTAIAAGNGRGSQGGRYAGVAPEAELLLVKLGNARQNSFPRTSELMQGLNYVLQKALEYQKPVAVNISFGNTYGSHDGTSLLERFIDDISNYWKNVICVGSGNEGTSAGHTSFRLSVGTSETVSLAVQENETTLNLQIWKSYEDEMEISIESPSGVRVGPFQEILGPQRFVLQETELLLYYGKPSPYSVDQEIFVDFLPRGNYIASGIWKIYLIPRKIVTGLVQMWLPSQSVLNQGTAFLLPVQNATITIPSTSARVITVGAYDARTLSYADFSGRGNVIALPSDSQGYVSAGWWKPDLVAPGVQITTLAADGGYRAFSGTSFATPFVTGSAALLMEWGIVKGNDPFLYGEKVKAYLRRGAKPLPGFTEYPNSQVGYGAICVENSLPM